jgi:hypothetical protein
MLSRSGGVIMFGTTIIKSYSSSQKCVTLTPMDAELNALIQMVKEVIHYRDLLHQLAYPQETPTIIYEDNQSAIHIADHPTGGKTKYLEVKMAFLRQSLIQQLIQLVSVTTLNQRADIMTKVLAYVKHSHDTEHHLQVTRVPN